MTNADLDDEPDTGAGTREEWRSLALRWQRMANDLDARLKREQRQHLSRVAIAFVIILAVIGACALAALFPVIVDAWMGR